MNERAKRILLRIRDHLWGPVGSAIFHVIALVLILQFAATQAMEKGPKVEALIMTPEATKLDDLDKTIEKEIEKVETPPPDTVVTPPPDVPVAANPEPDAIGNGTSGTGSGNAGGQGQGIGSGDSTGSGFEFSAVRGPLIMKGLFGAASGYGGRSPGGRSAALRMYKAPAGVEDAVLRALRWLKAHQKDDGSWPGHPTALTGYALLAFLAHGETPASPEFGQTVQKAIQFLMTKQGGGGQFDANGYANGIATYAMCEAYGMTKIMAVKDSAERAIQVVISGQQVGGGYNYNYQQGPRWDTSVSGWQLQALKAAKMAGLENPGIEKSMEKATQWLKNNSFNPQNGGFTYSGNGNDVGVGGSWTMTGVGVLCLQFYGHARDPAVRAGLKFLENIAFDWVKEKAPDELGKEKGKPTDGNGQNKVYGLYYVTQAKFQEGGTTWDAWNKPFATTLINTQGADGHWTGGEYGGSAGSPEVYTTSLCTLMLEVYYRYLPTYKKSEDTGPAQAASSDDVVVKVGG